MTNQIENSYKKQYGAEVHTAYQRQGSKLRSTVRSRNNVKGAIAVFQKVGKGTASTKARHGKVPVMNVDHTPVEVQLYDYYAGDWNDQLDNLKTDEGIEERQILANAGAYALGRKTDDLIISELDKSANYALDGTTGLTKAKVLEAFERLGNADVPDDGERYAIVGYRQWSELLGIQEFANEQFVGEDDLPWKGIQAKRWMGALWMPHSGLTKSGGIRYCYWYHKTAIAHACGAEVKSDITWHGDRAAWFINNSMSQGAGLIDPTGVVSLRCLES